jgi:hypothetical protein
MVFYTGAYSAKASSAMVKTKAAMGTTTIRKRSMEYDFGTRLRLTNPVRKIAALK